MSDQNVLDNQSLQDFEEIWKMDEFDRVMEKEMRKHKNRPLKLECDWCDKKFATGKNKNQHKQRWHDEFIPQKKMPIGQETDCNICENDYKTNYVRADHQRKMH